MELTWSTFVLEIVNFLILVWILKRFLYKPVLDVIERRRAAIAKTLADAEAKRAEADQIQAQYENRLADWEQQRRKAEEELQNSMAQERQRQLAELEASLKEERKKAAVVEEKRIAEQRRRDEETALGQGARFVGRLLERLRGPALEARLVALVLEDLPDLRPDRLEALREAFAATDQPVQVVSAQVLETEQRGELQQALAQVLGVDRLHCEFSEADDLVAGLRIHVGPWLLRANLGDELQFFVDNSHVG